MRLTWVHSRASLRLKKLSLRTDARTPSALDPLCCSILSVLGLGDVGSWSASTSVGVQETPFSSLHMRADETPLRSPFLYTGTGTVLVSFSLSLSA